MVLESPGLRPGSVTRRLLLFPESPGLRPGSVPGAVRWARGYFVTTIHKRDLPGVTRYVADQFQRHPDLIPRDSVPTPGASPRKSGGVSTGPGRKPGVNDTFPP